MTNNIFKACVRRKGVESIVAPPALLFFFLPFLLGGARELFLFKQRWQKKQKKNLGRPLFFLALQRYTPISSSFSFLALHSKLITTPSITSAAPSNCSSVITSGGASLMMLPCVGLASNPSRRSLVQTS